MESQSAILTSLLVEEAMGIFRPTVQELLRRRPERMAAAIVVLDPIRVRQGYTPGAELPVIWEGAIGEQDSSKWPNPYKTFARSKALVAWKNRMPGHLIHTEPWLFLEGDFKFPGAEVRGSLITSTSGLDWQDDFAVSAGLAGVLHGLCLKAFATEFARNPYFIGEADSVEPKA